MYLVFRLFILAKLVNVLVFFFYFRRHYVDKLNIKLLDQLRGAINLTFLFKCTGCAVSPNLNVLFDEIGPCV